MKKIILLLILACLMTIPGFSKNVSPEKAKQVAKTFVSAQQTSIESPEITLAATMISQIEDPFFYGQPQDHTIMYVFDISENGFVIVAGDDVANAILGYSSQASWQDTDQPYAFQKWIEGYKKQISFAISNGLSASEEASLSWDMLLNNRFPKPERAVNPLLTTTWDQSPYYNAQCPGGSVTGCVATAMAQVMKYWNYPAQGTGMHSYNHQTYGTLSANFGATTYNWSAMPNNVTSSNSAVATLMYHCGVSVNMDYSPEVSGAWVVEDDDPNCSESALKNYFGYSTSLHGEKRDNNYTTAQWVGMIKGELDAGRPVLYAGFGSGGGHAFVCDGYNNSNFFHFNWGWSGYYDGYFAIDALNPGGTGTGGGSGGYNSGHQALIGVVPASGGGSNDDNLVLYASVSVSPNPINIGQGFAVTTDIANIGTTSFSGDFGALVFDNNYNPVDFVQILQGYTMEPQTHFTNGLTFSTTGMSSLLPGNYFVGILYRPNGSDWNTVGNGDYMNLVPMSVTNSNPIELYSGFVISTGQSITQNQNFRVDVDVANYGTSTFTGTLDLSLYNLDGSFAQTIDAINNVTMEGGFYYNVWFETSGISLSPGTYYLALLHKWTGGDWEITGSTNYENPIQVVVREAALQEDVYEPNNHTTSARLLPLTWQNNTSSASTPGSNNHIGTDYDCYKIQLQNGYSYTINCRVHDSYNSGNGQQYTNDVLWSYNLGLAWVGTFDDVMPGNIVLQNGGDVYFLVAPYFLGETGTYLLDMQISRAPLGTSDLKENQLSVYPNPATDIVRIRNEEQLPLESIRIFDASGAMITNPLVSKTIQTAPQINIGQLPDGVYTIELQGPQVKEIYQIIKIK